MPINLPPQLEKPKPSFFVRAFKSLASLFLRTVFVFVVAEIALRLFGVDPHIPFVNAEGPFQIHPILKWQLKPNYRGKWSGVSFQTSGFGLRDDDFPPIASTPETRILVLGGSITTGYGMERPHGYVDQLEELLTRTQAERFQIINAGVPGYAPFQIYHFLKTRGLSLLPQMIWLDFAINDVTDKQMNLKRLGGTGEFRGGGAFFRFEPDSEPSVWKKWLRDLPRYTAVFTVAQKLKIKIMAKYLQEKEVDQQRQYLEDLLSENPSAEIEKAWAETLGEVLQIILLARAQNIPIGIVMFPVRAQVENEFGFNRPQRMMEAFCKEHRIPFVDLLPIFRQKIDERMAIDQLFLDDDHPTVTGHNLAAVTLHQKITPLLPGLQ